MASGDTGACTPALNNELDSMTLSIGSIFGDQEDALAGNALGFRITDFGKYPFNPRALVRSPSVCLEPFGDLSFGDGAFSDHAPVGLRDVDRCRARTAAQTAVEHQIDSSIHGCEQFYAARNRRLAGHIGAGRDQGMTCFLDNCIQYSSNSRNASPAGQCCP